MSKNRVEIIEACISELTDMDSVSRSDAIENLEELIDRAETLKSAMEEDAERDDE